MPTPQIDVIDLLTADQASLTLADVMDELNHQLAIVQATIAEVNQRGRGEWLDKLHTHADVLTLYLDEAAARAAEISNYLYDTVSVYRGDNALVDDDPDGLDV